MIARRMVMVLVLCVLVAGLAGGYVWYMGRSQDPFDGELDVARLERLVERGESFTVYFYDTTCPDCIYAEPFLREAIQLVRENGALPGNGRIYKCERAANATVRSLYAVDWVPTLVVFENGSELRRLKGQSEQTAEYAAFLQGSGFKEEDI